MLDYKPAFIKAPTVNIVMAAVNVPQHVIRLLDVLFVKEMDVINRSIQIHALEGIYDGSRPHLAHLIHQYWTLFLLL
jgi:hypothetical protein